MQDAQNTKIIQDAYAAFGRGDVPALLALLDDNVRWRPVVGASSSIPTAREWSGKAGVAEFFRILAEVQTFEQFEPREFIAGNGKVVVLGHYAGTPKATGRRFESDWVMVFTLENGKVTRFQEFSDSAAFNAAWA